jgi:hypothetical protein
MLNIAGTTSNLASSFGDAVPDTPDTIFYRVLDIAGTTSDLASPFRDAMADTSHTVLDIVDASLGVPHNEIFGVSCAVLHSLLCVAHAMLGPAKQRPALTLDSLSCVISIVSVRAVDVFGTGHLVRDILASFSPALCIPAQAFGSVFDVSPCALQIAFDFVSFVPPGVCAAGQR